MYSPTKIFLFLFLFLALFFQSKAQEVGQVDKGFGQNGHILSDYQHALKQVTTTLTLPGGRILVAGNIPSEGENRVWLSCFHADGSLDRNFGFQGKLPVVEMDQVSSLVHREDGSLLIGGSIFNGKDTDFAILSLDETGMPVRRFADNGLKQIDLRGSEQIMSLAIQPDGKIVAAGQGAPLRGQNTDLLVVRLHPDGELDFSFGMEGMSRIDLGRFDQCRDLKIQPDGKILLAGNSKVRDAYELAVVRLLSNGLPDYSFGEKGHRLIPVGIAGDSAKNLLLQKDGKILLAGHTQVGESDFDWFVLRLNSDGSPDLKFGNLSITNLNLGKDDFLGGMGLQSDGKMLLAGTSDFAFSLARLNEDGRIDHGFGTQGVQKISETDLPTVSGSKFVVQEDGKLLLSGAAEGDLVLMRLNGCPELPGLKALLEMGKAGKEEDQLLWKLAGGFEVAARFEAAPKPEGKMRGGRMEVKNHILAAAFLRLGKTHNFQIVIDAERKVHLFGGSKFLKTLDPSQPSVQ